MQQSKANSISCTLSRAASSQPRRRRRHSAIHRSVVRPYLSIYGYSETYEDESTNALKPMIDPKTVLLGCSKSPATTSFGSITQIEQSGEAASYSDLKFVPRRLATPREDRVELRIAIGHVWFPTTCRHGPSLNRSLARSFAAAKASTKSAKAGGKK